MSYTTYDPLEYAPFTFVGPYLMNRHIKAYYGSIKGNMKGIQAFLMKIRPIATKNKEGFLVYQDEEALFKCFQEQFPEYMQKRDISNWQELTGRVEPKHIV